MQDQKPLYDLLRCPLTGDGLALKGSELVSETGNVYPIFQNIPWMMPHPKHSLVDWQIKISTMYEYLVNESKTLAQRSKQASGLTQQRLAKLAAAKPVYAKQVVDITKSLLQTAPDQNLLNATLSHQAPRTQNLLSYQVNIYRDWVWGQDENKRSCDTVMGLMPNSKPKRIMMPGSGAGRLLYDLHRQCSPDISIGIDINPLLVFAADQLIRGQALSLYEFPSEPTNLDSVAIEQALQPAEEGANGIHVLFADVLNTAFEPGAFDLLVTPWLIDILPAPLEVTLQALNQYLPEGGHWINFGSLVFHQGDMTLHYTMDEMTELLGKYGFEIETHRSEVQPYLKSPHNAGYRMENVWSWRAVKTKSVAAPKNTQHLPSWLLDQNQPVPMFKEFAQLAQHNALSGEVLSWADGQTSLKKMTSRLSKKYKVDRAVAENSILQLYRQAYEDSTRRQYSF